MEKKPSLRRRRDALRLVAAVLALWLLLAISIAPMLAYC